LARHIAGHSTTHSHRRWLPTASPQRAGASAEEVERGMFADEIAPITGTLR
jgi:hypothetical protein